MTILRSTATPAADDRWVVDRYCEADTGVSEGCIGFKGANGELSVSTGPWKLESFGFMKLKMIYVTILRSTATSAADDRQVVDGYREAEAGERGKQVYALDSRVPMERFQ